MGKQMPGGHLHPEHRARSHQLPACPGGDQMCSPWNLTPQQTQRDGDMGAPSMWETQVTPKNLRPEGHTHKTETVVQNPTDMKCHRISVASNREDK